MSITHHLVKTIVPCAALLALGSMPAYANSASDFQRPGILIGADDDNQQNDLFQPASTTVNQSMNNTDILGGGEGQDILIGLLGSDVLEGGTGNDILIGGPENFVAPNSDVALGGSGNDIFIWAPGDGSDAFIGGEGDFDAIIFGVIDRTNGVPNITPSPIRPRTGIPTANVSGQGGFCSLERLDRAVTGYDFLVRFTTRNDGIIKVTVRLRDVEEVFCTSEAGGAVTYANLRDAQPTLDIVSLNEVAAINGDVSRIIR